MRETFNIVRGAVSTKDLIPVLTHFAIHNGRLSGGNGRVQITAPLPELKKLSLTVPATPFIAAMDGCGDIEPKIAVTDDGHHLAVTCKKFRAQIPIGDITEFPQPADGPNFLYQDINSGLLRALTLLRPLVGEDASRPWCATVNVADGLCMATNNVVLAFVDYEPGVDLAPFAVPMFAIDELIRIGRDPVAVVLSDTAVEFILPGTVHVRCTLLNGEWPDAARVLKAGHEGAKLRPFDPGVLDASVAAVVPFCGDQKLPRVDMTGRTVLAAGGVMRGEFDVPGVKWPVPMAFHVKPLRLVLSMATAADWSRFPRVPWTGNGVRGVLLGLVK